MKARLSPLVQEIRGSIGPTVFRHLGGASVSVSASPAKRSIHTQGRPWQSRGMSYLVDRFNGLGTVRLGMWDYWSFRFWRNLRNKYENWPYGVRSYLVVNLLRYKWNLPILDDPPPVAARAPIPAPAATMYGTYFKIWGIGQLPGAGEWFSMHMSKPRSLASQWVVRDADKEKLWTGPLTGDQYWFWDPPHHPGTSIILSTILIDNTHAPSRAALQWKLWP